MKIVFAIDSFKGSMSSVQAGEAAAEGARRVFPDAELVVCPLADGGEGTVDALVAAMGGQRRVIAVDGPLGEKVLCAYGVLPESKTAVIEMAGAAGLTLVPPEQRNPMYTSTYGVGQVIADAIAQGCRHFIVGIGGSATNDGGAGMLQALGFGLKDADGADIARGAMGLQQLYRIDESKVMPELKECDVTNPLCGDKGATAIFGPQKGATKETIPLMDGWLANYGYIAKDVHPEADLWYPGSGAAGGLGFALRTFLGAQLQSGIEIVLEESRIEGKIADADIVVTGEGRLDGQTAMGKAPIGVAKLAKKHGCLTLALSGAVTADAGACNDAGIDAFFPIVRGVTTLDEAMDVENAVKNMANAAEQAFRLIKAARGK